jgi:hypothetical protein
MVAESGPVKQKPKALLLAGIRAYANLHEDLSSDGNSPRTASEHVGSVYSIERLQPSTATDQRASAKVPAAAGNNGDASLDSFVASFVAEVEDSPGTLRNLRY